MIEIDDGASIDEMSDQCPIVDEEGLVYRLRKRAEIRRNIPGRKSVQEGKPDRMAALLDEAADEIEKISEMNLRQTKKILDRSDTISALKKENEDLMYSAKLAHEQEDSSDGEVWRLMQEIKKFEKACKPMCITPNGGITTRSLDDWIGLIGPIRDAMEGR